MKTHGGQQLDYDSRSIGSYLFRDDLSNLGVTVTERVNRDSRSQIQVPTVFHIPQVTSLALHHHGSWANIGGDHEGSTLVNE